MHKRKNKSIRKIALIIAVIVVIVGAANHALSQLPQRSASFVTDVVDGDTLTIEGGERVRLLYIDTAERGEPCYAEAKQRLEELVDKKDVVLEKAGENRDRSGRLLRYVYVGGIMTNLVLVEEGLAKLYVFDKGPYHNTFADAERAGMESGGCIWK